MAQAPSIASKKLPRILDHYILPDTLEGTFKGKCKHCSKLISGTTKVTTNWLKHMVSKLLASLLLRLLLLLPSRETVIHPFHLKSLMRSQKYLGNKLLLPI